MRVSRRNAGIGWMSSSNEPRTKNATANWDFGIRIDRPGDEGGLAIRWGILAEVVAVAIGPIDEGQYLGYGLVHPWIDVIAFLADLEQEPSHGFVLHQRNLMLTGDLTDAERVEALPLGYHPRRFVDVRIELESHRQVCGIGDHDIGGWNGFHPVQPHLPHHLLHPGLRLRIAFARAGFLLHLLLGHLQFPGGFPELVAVVPGHDECQAEEKPSQEFFHGLTHEAEELLAEMVGKVVSTPIVLPICTQPAESP